jgi:nicotinate-nucleotide--dimethylbenzimidazole phosphoribosyltransferase
MTELEQTIELIRPVDRDKAEQAQRRLDSLTKPRGSLGRLEELAKQVAGITGRDRPEIAKKAILVMAGDHGVADEGVSAYPKEVTPQMVCNFLRGGAGINVLSKHIGARVVVVDMGVAVEIEPHPELIVKKVAPGTANIACGPAMSREQAIEAVETGILVVESEVEKGLDILGTGDMGIANTTPSSAIASVLVGVPVESMTGRGTGIDDEKLALKVSVIEKALEVNNPDPANGIDVLAKVGGFEIGGLAGVMLASAAHRIPVVIDGFISGAAALIAAALSPLVKEYMIAAHCSVEPGHRIVLEHLGLKPLLDFDMRLGEGTGAALGISLVEAAVKILNEMATFGEAGVSERTD